MMINSKKFILLQENKKNTLIVQQESRVFYPPTPLFFPRKKRLGIGVLVAHTHLDCLVLFIKSRKILIS